MSFPIKDPHETDFKVGDKILLKNHSPTTAFDVKYKTSYRILNDYLIKPLTHRTTQERLGKHPNSTCNFYI